MATKKKTTSSINYLAGYVPATYNPNITSNEIKQIPPYGDQGVRFEGYFKRLKGNTYELVKQDENSIGIGIGTNLAGLGAGSYTINRGHAEQNFIIESLYLSYIQSGVIQSLTIADSDGNNSITIRLPTSTGDIINIPFIPKTFKGQNIIITISLAIPVNQFISLHLVGWYENK